MADHPDLFTPKIRPPVAPAGRSGPRLWVRRLAIFKDPQTLIRSVPLKPGLNIIWSPSMASSGALAHGSGKTTFCRLLRACLGELDYAPETQRNRIKNKLSSGLVAAEIIIDGVCWVAVRPLGLSGGEFVVHVNSIEEALARMRRDGDQTSLDPIVTGTFFSTIAETTPPEVGRGQVWDVLRAWLTRDQECRLADILAWRSPRTQTRSRAQLLGETSKLTMVRLALRALDAEEQEAANRERQLVAAAEKERGRQEYNRQRYAEKLKEARTALDVGDDVGFDDTLEQKGLISLAEMALAEAMRAELPDPPDVGSIFTRLKALNEERDLLVDNKSDLEKEAQLKRTRAEQYRSEANVGEIDVAQGRIRVCSICKVPVSEVLAKGCKISLERPDLPARRAEIAEKHKKAAQLDSEVNGAEQEAKRVEALIQQLDRNKRTLEAEAKEANAAIHSVNEKAKRVQDRVYQAQRTLDDVRSLRETSPVKRTVPPAISALETVRAQLDLGRSRARAAIRTLEERYQGIIAGWLPEGVEGTIKLDGNGLKVDAQFSGRGDISTAALDSLTIVAFDLAALHMAVEELADLPAFLVHDSPREADLDEELYARLFRLVHQWEKEAGIPCFQYIVTTTTAPPSELRNDSYVMLEMRSTPAESRLFGMDI